MSILSKGLKSVKKMVTHPREWASNAAKSAAPVASFINPALGVGLAAFGGATQKGGNVLKNIGREAGPAALSAVAGGGLRSLAPGNIGQGVSQLRNLPSQVGGQVARQGFGDTLRSVGGWALDNPDVLLSGAGMIQGAMQQGKADKLNRQALDLAKQPWQETQGLRSVMLDRAMNPRRPDLSSIYAGSPNPFSR